MEIKELKIKKEKELQSLLAEKREKLRLFKFDLASGKVKNVREIRSTRKDIAQVITILNENRKQNKSK